MGHSLLSFILHTETNNLWSRWQRLNIETGLTVASMGSSIPSGTCALYRDLYSAFFYGEHSEFHSSGISIDHEELLLRHPGAVNWHKIPQLWQKQDSSWTAKQSFKLTNRLNQYSWVCHQAAHVRYYEWAVNQVSINVWASKFHGSLSNWWRAVPSVCLRYTQVYIDFSAHTGHKVMLTLHITIPWKWVTEINVCYTSFKHSYIKSRNICQRNGFLSFQPSSCFCWEALKTA